MNVDALRELILQAHNCLHAGDVGGAHERLHQALGIDAAEPPPALPLLHRLDFDQAFRTACRKHGARAMYLLADSTRADGKTRILAGGDADLCAWARTVIPASA